MDSIVSQSVSSPPLDMPEVYETHVKSSYAALRSLYVPAPALRRLAPGPITVLIENDDEFSVQGTLNLQGQLSGMAKLYAKLSLRVGTPVHFVVKESTAVVIRSPLPPAGSLPDSVGTLQTVFEQRQLRHLHFEVFRPENLDNWEPETETDIYLAFGVLQDFTDFQYCCGVSKALLTKLGANYEESAKPDAILIDRNTDQYLLAEWKKYSTDYKLNHAAADVDVLVCWHDNELDRTKLPIRILALRSIAKTAAGTKLSDE
jgi:hypothetical protein